MRILSACVVSWLGISILSTFTLPYCPKTRSGLKLLSRWQLRLTFETVEIGDFGRSTLSRPVYPWPSFGVQSPQVARGLAVNGQTTSHLRRCLTATLAVGLHVCSLHGQISDVLKSAQIDTLFARTEESLTVKRTPTYGVVFQVAEGKPGRYQIYEEADEIWFVRSGRAGLSMGPRLSSAREVEPGKLVGAGIQTPRRFEVAAGDIVNLPRGTAHQLDPGNDRFEYVVVRVFPTDAHPVRRFQNPSPMGDVLKHSERAAVFANNNSNQPLHSVRNVSVNYVIYQGHPGPWEAHRGCVDIYFVGSSQKCMQLDRG